MELSYNEIIKWLEDYHKGQGDVKTYRGLEYSKEFAKDVKDAKTKRGGAAFSIDPLLPIDLLAVKRTPAIDDKTNRPKIVFHYTLFWLISKDYPHLERRLQFYRFYLSRIAPLSAVMIIMVITVNIETDIRNKLRKIAQDNSFGLWQVETTKKTPEVLCPSLDFRAHMEENLKNPQDPRAEDFNKTITAKAKDIALFFDKHVSDAVESVVGITPKQVDKRYIERRILDLVFDLKNVSYAETLRSLVTQHLIQKNNEYDFVSDAFSKLWRQCGLEIEYADFLEVFEPPLFNIYARQEKPYRDHYLHQFQVFLLGLAIIDNDKLRKKFPADIDKLWLITSSFHDMAYPIQKYDEFAQKFFSQSLGIPEIGASDIKSFFVEGSLLSSMGYLINAFCELHFNDPLKGNWLQQEMPLVLFFYKIITGRKPHCVLSSLCLLKQAQSCNPGLRDSLFVRSALAIALHHRDIWSELPAERAVSSLKFDSDSLAFLLMFCDCAQEWGRPMTMEEEEEEEEEEKKKGFFLDKCVVKKTGCSITIRAPSLVATDKLFTRKVLELDGLQRFLQPQSGMKFEITLKDKSGAKRDYPMIGH